MVESFFIILTLIFLEGVLSVDNAVVLALLVKDLPEEQRKKALTYGIWGAFGFRILALLFLTYLIKLTFIKFIAAVYLLYIVVKHFFVKEKENAYKPVPGFWNTVVAVELCDIAFSIDSIMAAVALSDQMWVIVLGGLLGILTMRLVAYGIIDLVKKFPWIETVAYVLIGLVAVKLLYQSLY